MWPDHLRQPGIFAALGAALLFGAGTPLAKLLLATVDPWLLAALLYLGSGLGLALWSRRHPRTKLKSCPARMMSKRTDNLSRRSRHV